MPDYPESLRRFARATTLDEARLDRLRRGATRPPRRAPIAVALVAVAAVLALVLRPPPRVDGPLASGRLTDEVSVAAEGAGTVTGAGKTLAIAWERGALDVAVTPDAGVRLDVRTEEAVVRVVGTRFEVDRGALGTRVAVEAGRVTVQCLAHGGADAPARVLGAADADTCPPVTRAGMLGRVLTLRATGTPDDALLTELDDALARPPAGAAVAAELGALRVEVLLGAGRQDDALVVAEAVLAEGGGAREADLRRIAARLRFAAGDCAGARPHLTWLAGAGVLGDDAPALAACTP